MSTNDEQPLMDKVIQFRPKADPKKHISRSNELPSKLVEAAPGVLSDYIGWYLDSARNPERVYALTSALGFIACHAGPNYHLPDCYLNHNILCIGPTESGKQFILIANEIAINQSEKSSITSTETHFVSSSALWWKMSESPQGVMWFQEEIGKYLRMANNPGSHAYDVVKSLLVMHDAVLRQTVNPHRYSEREKAGKDMAPLSHPFLVLIGTSTPNLYADTHGVAGEDGSLNRFLVLHCDGDARQEMSQLVRPLSPEMTRFMDETPPLQTQLAYAPGVELMRLEWDEALKETRRANPGVWGRLGLKASRLALTAAVASRSGVVSIEHMQWAMEVAETAARLAERLFTESGGLSFSRSHALEQAILACITRAGENVVVDRKYIAHRSRPYRAASKREREDAIQGLIDNELIAVYGGNKYRIVPD